MKRTMVAAAVAALALLVFVSGAAAASPLTNPGFETGDFTGWGTDSEGAGAFLVTGGGGLPISGLGSPGPAEGRFMAAFDQGGPSGAFLAQDVVVPPNGKISFAYAYSNYEGEWVMDEVNPWDLGTFNQWISIDVLKGGSDPTSLDPADVITTVFRPSGNDPMSSGWKNVSVNLPGEVGNTVELRFAAADTEFYLTLLVDAPGSPHAAAPVEVTHAGYCTVPGNTTPDGTPIPPGTFVNLEIGQPDTDPHYKGAQPANFVQGIGITCDQIPLGFTQQGMADESMGVPGGIYPYWAAPPATSAFRLSRAHWLH